MRSLVAALLLCLVPFAAQARPSPSIVTVFAGDKYSGQVQIAGKTAKAKRAARVRHSYPTRRHAPPRARERRQHIPMPVPRPIAEPGAVEPLTLFGGMGREVRRMAGRPRAWCGWWLGQHLGMHDRKLWLARNWASVGSSAGGPQIGAVVVWRHHVGIITGQQNGKWIVKSGNDGRRVRERPRSVAGAIAFRRV
jgi:hypothetical protein